MSTCVRSKSGFLSLFFLYFNFRTGTTFLRSMMVKSRPGKAFSDLMEIKTKEPPDNLCH